jgi:hypothetical protein
VRRQLPRLGRRLLLDERFVTVIKLLETPRGDDALAADRRNLDRLRGYRLAPGVSGNKSRSPRNKYPDPARRPRRPKL